MARESDITSWYKLLKEAMEEKGEDFSKRICTLSEEKLRLEWDYSDFDSDEGEHRDQKFTAWGEKWVYIASECECSYYIIAAPRNPPTTP